MPDTKTVPVDPKAQPDNFNPSQTESYAGFPSSNVKSTEIYNGKNEPLGNKDEVKG